MRAAIALLLVPTVLGAQQSQSPLAGLFPERQGPASNYAGYAFAECGPENTPAVRLVALQGLVPEGIPKTSPRPSIELVVYRALDASIIGQKINLSPKPETGGAMALSCPVVGQCAPAQSGAISITGRGENGNLTGEFGAQWAIGAPRLGRFTLIWRDSQVKCG